MCVHVCAVVKQPTGVRQLNFARLLISYTKRFALTDPREALQYYNLLKVGGCSGPDACSLSIRIHVYYTLASFLLPFVPHGEWGKIRFHMSFFHILPGLFSFTHRTHSLSLSLSLYIYIIYISPSPSLPSLLLSYTHTGHERSSGSGPVQCMCW